MSVSHNRSASRKQGRWLARRDNNTPGDADDDYYQAEWILESQRRRKLLLLPSFAFLAIAFVLGRSAEEHQANAINASRKVDLSA